MVCLNASYAHDCLFLGKLLLAIASPVHMTESGRGFSNLERQKVWFAKISCHTVHISSSHFLCAVRRKAFQRFFSPLGSNVKSELMSFFSSHFGWQ